MAQTNSSFSETGTDSRASFNQVGIHVAVVVAALVELAAEGPSTCSECGEIFIVLSVQSTFKGLQQYRSLKDDVYGTVD
jgi:hypothetical protein